MSVLQTKMFHWVGNPILGDREGENSPKQVHLALKPKPFSQNGSNCVMTAINLPAALISLLLSNSNSSEEDGHYILTPSNFNIYFPMYFPKVLLSRILIPSHNFECGCRWGGGENWQGN